MLAGVWLANLRKLERAHHAKGKGKRKAQLIAQQRIGLPVVAGADHPPGDCCKDQRGNAHRQIALAEIAARA
jgi:hypothetical protein